MNSKIKTLSQKWDLESLYKGGSKSTVFKDQLREIEVEIDAFMTGDLGEVKWVAVWEGISEALQHADSFICCLLAQDVHDSDAETLEGILTELKAKFINKTNLFDRMLASLSKERFDALMKSTNQSFPFIERVTRVKEKLSIEQESLLNDLAVDGYHGWSKLYHSVLGRELIPFRGEFLSWGQAYNKLSDSDETVRQEIFEASNHLWNAHSHIYSQVINHIAGFRLKMYEHRGWDFLKEPLDSNRMQKKTLEAMWSAIEKNKKPFIDSLQKKAKSLGRKKLRWFDLDAPVATSNKQESLISYEEASSFIITQFATVSPRLSAFAEKALSKGWVEAEDRPGKRPGGFCVGIPLRKESRIFMTYSGTYESLFTLAHEIGHAYHNEVIFHLPDMSRHFPMNLAETASTFAEMVVSEAAYHNEKDETRKKQLLDMKMQRNIAFLCNIHARFLFETAFYEERKSGNVSTDRLCFLMEQAQMKAYDEALDEYHPYFWASKMHFNFTDVPFYNFPYTFGYLFSLGVYLKGIQKENFDEWYAALLADTGRMTAEDLALKHLNADLTTEKFWQECLDYLIQQIL
jgi:oligoendopeptidase F